MAMRCRAPIGCVVAHRPPWSVVVDRSVGDGVPVDGRDRPGSGRPVSGTRGPEQLGPRDPMAGGGDSGEAPVHPGGRQVPLATPRSAGRVWRCPNASLPTGCASCPAGGWTCQRASASRRGSRARRTSPCCCTWTAARCRTIPCRSGLTRTPQGDGSPTTRQPGTIRPLRCAYPPCLPALLEMTSPSQVSSA